MISAIFLAQTDVPAKSLGADALKRLADFLTPWAGAWIGQDLGFGITWLQLIASTVVILLTIGVAGILRWLLHCKMKREGKKAAVIPAGEITPTPVAHEHWWHAWLKLILQAGLPPLMLFVCAWGFYAAFRLLFAHLQIGDAPQAITTALDWCKKTANFVALFWFLFRLVGVIEVELRRWSKHSERKWDDVLAALVTRALRLVVPLLGVILIVPTLDIPAAYHDFLRQGTSLLLIAAIGFILFQLTATLEKAVVEQYRIDVKDNLAMRKVQTQVRVLKRVAVVVIAIFTLASMLMVFDSVRQLGTSLLASAGIAGIVIGFAAQKSISTIIAGIQIAFTQPIRIDDVVIVEGEYGNIEEITMTYVVVKIWDLRRLVVPIANFIEKPFENWTRTGSNLLGTVMLYLDYTVPVPILREELDRILANSKLWDGQVKGIQVTEAKESTLEVRVLVSAADSGAAWDLRCEVREKLIDFLQHNYPQCLPRRRQGPQSAPAHNGSSTSASPDLSPQESPR